MICVSLVCRCPFILPPLTEEWILVADCYVRDSMDAEAFRFQDVDEFHFATTSLYDHCGTLRFH